MSRRPVIFLDIDGVLNDHTKHPGSMYCGVKPECMAIFNDLIRRTEAAVVIHSAWRYLVINGHMSLVGFQNLLATHGMLEPDRIVDCTRPDSEVYRACDAAASLKDRAKGILEWFESQSEFDRFIVLDDLPVPISSLVQTVGTVGLTGADAYAAFRLLTRNLSGEQS